MELPVPSTSAPGPAALQWAWQGPAQVEPEAASIDIRNDHYVPPPPSPQCTPESADLPCSKGITNGTLYPYTAYVHCGLQALFADGSWWQRTSDLGGDGSAPAGWGNPFDVGTVQLKAGLFLIYRSSTNQMVIFKRTTEPPPVCS